MNSTRFTTLIAGAGLTLGAQAVAGGAAGSSSVKLWPTAVVIEDVIRLDDVAELGGFDTDTETALNNLVLASAPEPGGSKIMPLSDIREALANFGVNRARVIVKGSAECAVRRPVETARPAPEAKPQSDSGAGERPTGGRTLRDAVLDHFDRQLVAYDGRADVSFGRTAAQVLDLSSPEFTFRVRRKTGPTLGLIHIDVDILRGATEVQRVPMVVSVAMTREVVVASKPINRGATVRAEDVRVVSRRFTKPGRNGMSDVGQTIGLRAQRFIPAGELVSARDLERVPLVKRGQIVEVHSRFGSVTVKTSAKVGEDGDYGELVTLHMQGRRGARTAGRVVGPRRVQVGDWEPSDLNQSLLADGGWR